MELQRPQYSESVNVISDKDDDMIILNTFAIHFVSHFAVYEASEAPTCENNGKMMNLASKK